MALSAFPYPGGKTRMVDEILAHVPDHRRYVELFGGSAALLLNKPESYVEVYNDRNSDVVHFFRTVRERRDDLQEWLRAVPYSRELHERWARAFYDGHRPEDDVERAGRWFYLRYTQYGAKIDRYSGFKTSIKRSEPRSFRGAIDRLDAVVERFQDVVVECDDYATVVDRYDRPDTLFYGDPPYVETDYNYYGGGQFDHQRLFDVFADADGQWIVSYGQLPDVRIPPRLARDLTVREFEASYTLDVAEGESHAPATESLVMNFDPDVSPAFTDAEQTTLGTIADGGNDA